MHLFLYASSASENWNYGGVSKCFVIAIWDKYIYIYIYTHIYMLPPTKNIFIYFLCYWSLFVHTHFDGHSNPSSVLISPWFGSLAHLCSGHALLDIYFLGITCECATELAIIVFIYYYYCCITYLERCINVFYQSWRSKPWPWDHYASWAPWIVNW